MTEKTLLSDYDFELPPELIAQEPLPNRDDSRMMVVNRQEKSFSHQRFRDLPQYFSPGDVLVINDSKVVPARAWGQLASQPGASIEFLFVREIEPGVWEVLCRPARKLKLGVKVTFTPELEAEVLEIGQFGHRLLRFNSTEVRSRLKEIGVPPLPPYIKRRKNDPRLRTIDLERYQTVYARQEGSIAAPTAGLHFTPATLEALKNKGVDILHVTLNVGEATFQPVRVQEITHHQMLAESFYIPEETAEAINRAKKEGRKITAVGTTAVRTLEGAWSDSRLPAGGGKTNIFIYPGYRFQVVDRLLTNFHLPKSTLIMLVSALAGYDLIMAAYREAIAERYRFFSYGDCMLIL
ncbi:MAG TPA: tRNA preQ1(34) S-adenosylmethionine ribosyltransferase-isomerase QueA [Candidatus Saccharicenans sp.]|nr:tRNA preQ1(34) S-adenosylmethionine ribosyltransferase-isomerase QueA [Candidatus Saccharicenans sp.]HUM79867.1 tRNA preQ1(34) S-adenosylmethionine ribosyltransferase-isomerase QueA [Candidatus Saccharicenans sp.]